MQNKEMVTLGMSVEKLASMIDHTRLGPATTIQDVHILCREAAENQFASVCIPPCYVKEANLMLTEKPPVVCTVVGFPHGNNCTGVKTMEASIAIQDGAEEIDMVMAVGLLKSGRYDAVRKDIQDTVRGCEGAALVKVILECVLLTDEEKRVACLLAQEAGANYVKTSTGYSQGGATEKDIALMHAEVGETLGVKASGGIRTGADAIAMIRAGATRIGASASLSIIQDLKMVNENLSIVE